MITCRYKRTVQCMWYSAFRGSEGLICSVHSNLLLSYSYGQFSSPHIIISRACKMQELRSRHMHFKSCNRGDGPAVIIYPFYEPFKPSSGFPFLFCTSHNATDAERELVVFRFTLSIMTEANIVQLERSSHVMRKNQSLSFFFLLLFYFVP